MRDSGISIHHILLWRFPLREALLSGFASPPTFERWCFDGYGLKTLPKVKDLTSLIQELMTEQKKQYQKYRETRTEMQNWQAVKQNLDSALNRAEKEKHRGLDR
jgi:hypothetical protein